MMDKFVRLSALQNNPLIEGGLTEWERRGGKMEDFLIHFINGVESIVEYAENLPMEYVVTIEQLQTNAYSLVDALGGRDDVRKIVGTWIRDLRKQIYEGAMEGDQNA